MVVSLYICEIPKNVTKQDIENIFCEFDGYKETRMKGNDIDKRKIAFVDYETESNARFALETLNGFKFSVNDKGIFIKFSDNNKNGENQGGKPKPVNKYLNKKRTSSKSPESDHEKYRKKRYEDYNNPTHKKEDFERRSNSYQSNNYSNSSNNKVQSKNFTPNNQPNVTTNNTSLNNTNENTSNNNNNNLNMLTDFVNILQNTQALNLFSNLTGLSNGNNNTASNEVINPTSNINNFTSLIGNLASSIASTNQPVVTNTQSNGSTNSLIKFDNELKKIMDFPKNATNIVYVEGFPYETTEREISHIFRPFPGFLSVRLITREKNGEKTLICFADFENVYQSTICIYTLQGYRFDKNDLVGLHFSYGVNKQKK